MSPQTYALLERLHGHLALLGLALLVHPLVTLRRRPGLSRRTLLSADLAALLLLLPYVGGWLLYPTYRGQVKPDLVRDSLPLARIFESKEHLALMALSLVLGGVAVLHAAGRQPEGRTAAWWLLAAGLLCGGITAGLGVAVAAGAAPGW